MTLYVENLDSTKKIWELINELSKASRIRIQSQYTQVKLHFRNSLVVQWLALCTFTAEGLGSIPGQGTKILQAMLCSQK